VDLYETVSEKQATPHTERTELTISPAEGTICFTRKSLGCISVPIREVKMAGPVYGSGNEELTMLANVAFGPF
jgi:hypothetical protein